MATEAKEEFRSLLEESSLLQEIFSYVKNLDCEDPAHDFSHALRVLGNALTIAQAEGGDREILCIAALLHDAQNLPKAHPDAGKSSAMSADFACSFLLERGFAESRVHIVYDAIYSHSFTLGKTPRTLEGKILQDADRLDAIGILGIMRAFAVSGKMGTLFYHPHDPFYQTSRELMDRKYALDHFYQKLYVLEKIMQTETGKRLAHERTETMKRIMLLELEKEIQMTSGDFSF